MNESHRRTAPTAHDRLKASFWSYVWAGTLLSVAAHFALIRFTHFEGIADYSYGGVGSLEQLAIEEDPREFDIPPPPDRIQRPAVPVLSTNLSLSDDITIGEINFDEIPVIAPPPPP